MADRMTLSRDARGWRGEVMHGGRRALSVAFTPHGAGDVAPPREESLLALIAGPASERPYFLLVPAGRGPWLNRLGFSEVVSCEQRARTGRVTVDVEVDEPWVRLFAGGGAVGPAKVLETAGTGFGWLTSERVGLPRHQTTGTGCVR